MQAGYVCSVHLPTWTAISSVTVWWLYAWLNYTKANRSNVKQSRIHGRRLNGLPKLLAQAQARPRVNFKTAQLSLWVSWVSSLKSKEVQQPAFRMKDDKLRPPGSRQIYNDDDDQCYWHCSAVPVPKEDMTLLQKSANLNTPIKSCYTDTHSANVFNLVLEAKTAKDSCPQWTHACCVHCLR